MKMNFAKKLQFSGHAAIFNIADRDGDVIESLAFEGVDRLVVPLLLEHEGPPVGRVNKIKQNMDVMFVEGEIFVALLDENTLLSICQKLINGLSIGYVLKDATTNNLGQRVVSKAELVEISIVAIPSSPNARILEIKTTKQTIDEIEKLYSLCKIEKQLKAVEKRLDLM